MNYNFGEDTINYNYETVQEEQFPDPLNYLNSDFGIQNKQRNSLDDIVRPNEIPSSFTEEMTGQ